MDGTTPLESPVGVERFSQGPSVAGSGIGKPEVDEKAPVIEIHFRRDPRLTGGPGECAWCEVEGQRYEIPPKAKGKNGGAVYRLVVMLAKAGYEGRAFETHDGRMACLRGTIDLCAVPIEYGGEKKSGKAPRRSKIAA